MSTNNKNQQEFIDYRRLQALNLIEEWIIQVEKETLEPINAKGCTDMLKQ